MGAEIVGWVLIASATHLGLPPWCLMYTQHQIWGIIGAL